MYKISEDWLTNAVARTGGCFALNQTLKRHNSPEILKEYVKTIVSFTQSEEGMVDYYIETLSQFHSEDMSQYF